jgi:hypothetical protein
LLAAWDNWALVNQDPDEEANAVPRFMLLTLSACLGLLVLAAGRGPAAEPAGEHAPSVSNRDFQPRRVVPPMPPIVDAPFVAADLANRVNDADLVLGVVVGGAARAYPINMLTGPRREIINDTLGGRAIAATW